MPCPTLLCSSGALVHMCVITDIAVNFNIIDYLSMCLSVYLFICLCTLVVALSALTLWWGAGMVICLELGADLHMAQLMPLPLTVSCFSKIQIGFTLLVPAHLGSPGKRADKWVCVCVYVSSSTIRPHGSHNSRASSYDKPYSSLSDI